MDDTAKASRLAKSELDAEKQQEYQPLKHAGNATYAGQQEASGVLAAFPAAALSLPTHWSIMTVLGELEVPECHPISKCHYLWVQKSIQLWCLDRY